MEIEDGILYGIIQALTEFLPVSSSGHLALIPHFFNFQDPGVAFDLAMHIGTAFAVIAYFYRDIIEIIKSPRILNYFIATLVTVVLAFLFKDFAQDYARTPVIIALNLFVFGWLLFFSDKRRDDREEVFQKNFLIKESIMIGFSQAIAVFPGVSRSGITIMMGRFLGFNIKESSSFSFLLSIPVILGGAVLKANEISKSGDHFEVIPMLVGLLTSFILGLIVIHYFFKLIRKMNLVYFAIYRSILAALIIIYLS